MGSLASSQLFLNPNNRPWALFRKVMPNFRPRSGYFWGGDISEQPGSVPHPKNGPIYAGTENAGSLKATADCEDKEFGECSLIGVSAAIVYPR